MNAKTTEGFRRVNSLATDAHVIEFLDVTEALPFTQNCKARMRDLAPPAPSAHVLDVGCGLGHEIRRLAAIVGSGGRLVGIDASAAAIAEARCRTKDSNIEFFHGNAELLPFADASFDLVRAERVAEYVDSPHRMFREMARVLRIGGRMVVFDFDYSGFMVDATDRRISEQVKCIVAEAVPNPWIGGSLRRFFVDIGLSDVNLEPMTFVMPFDTYYGMTASALSAAAYDTIDPVALAQWWAALRAAERNGGFFAAIPGMIAVGTKLA